ncbi:MAG: thiamine pyrophosphate-dependent enzyme [Candidatus Hydrogenedentota bacterium]
MSGNEAVALAALHGGVALGTGYPGTPSTEILEHLSAYGGRAQWAPNEKVALEVGIGAAFAGVRVLVTMKHVGVNVAADPFFSVAYTGVDGALVIVSADDPGMHSSQNEQDNRRFALAAGMVMFEPADAQDAYDFTRAAFAFSEAWNLPVMLRMTTRVCHSQGVVRPAVPDTVKTSSGFKRHIPGRVMIPGHARHAHRQLRAKLEDVRAWSENEALHREETGSPTLGIITAGVAYLHAREAAPEASLLKLAMTHPLPLAHIRKFAESVDRCMVIEEGDPYLVEQLCAAGIAVTGKPARYRLGELNVPRVRRILAGDDSEEPAPPRGKLPQLCVGCPHRGAFAVTKRLGCIVSGDIGCYTLAALPPFEAMDSQLCMGASIGIGLGLRHTLPEEAARRVVSVIGDSTFMHSGLTGLAEMVYNPPSTGHIVLVLDNGTTAMTGMQEHPGTGRSLDHRRAGRVSFEDVARAMGVGNVCVAETTKELAQTLTTALEHNGLTFIVFRHPCRLAKPRIEAWEAQAAGETAAVAPSTEACCHD